MNGTRQDGQWEVHGSVIRRHRLRRGLTVTALAELVGHRRPWLWEVETGRTQVRTIADAVRFSRALNVPLEDLVASTEVAPLSPLPALEGLYLPWTTDGSLLAQWQIGRDMDRRSLLASGAALVAVARGWLDRADPDDAGRGSGPRISEEMAASAEATIAHLRRLDDRHGSAQVISLARQQLGIITGLAASCSYSDAVGRRLHGAAAELLAVCGWLSYDSGLGAEAQRYWTAGLHAAKAAGDRATGVDIVTLLAAQAWSPGSSRGDCTGVPQSPADSLALARIARAAYQDPPPKMASIIDFQVARALASTDTTGARRELARGLDRRWQDDVAGEPDWSHWVDEAAVHRMAGGCYLALRDWSAARRHLEDAERTAHGAMARDNVPGTIMLASAYAAPSGTDVERAVELGHAALDRMGTIDSPRCVAQTRDLGHALVPYSRQPSVRELRDRIRQTVA